MNKKKNLGIFWGQDSFSLVEVATGQSDKIIYMPFDTPVDDEQSQDIPESIKLAALIKKAVKDNNLSSKSVDLSIPIQDLIFRSFIIPWMKPEEMKNVIDFEATKYIPIRIENLSFIFQTISFN